MSRPPANKPPIKDMYWFAHGGIETNQKGPNIGEGEEDTSDSMPRSLTDRRLHLDESKSQSNSNSNSVDSCNSSGPPSLETRDERQRNFEKHLAAEERRKQLFEAEQERNDAVLKKHLEREAALEARRNAQRTSISFAFGSSIPRNIETLQNGAEPDKGNRPNASGSTPREENHNTLHHYRRSVSPVSSRLEEADDFWLRPFSPQSNFNGERKSFSPSCCLVGSGALIGEDIMSKSMTASVPALRGRRKNDLMPVVHYERLPAPENQPRNRSNTTTRKRSVSMTRLDQLAQPRKHYVEANKAGSTHSSGASSVPKDVKSPKRPLSSASEQSGGSGLVGNSAAVRRVRSSPRKPRPVSIAGTVPDHKFEARISPIKKTSVTKKPVVETKKATPSTSKPPAKVDEKKKVSDKTKASPQVASTPPKHVTSTPKPATKKTPQFKTSSPKTPALKKTVTNKKKADLMTSSQEPVETAPVPQPELVSPADSPTPDSTEADRNNSKKIISEEEAKMALAEKRRLAREQAEKEAELERQRQEELVRQEEERLRLEEEEQKKMEEEQLRLLEEHRKGEEEKLRKAIEDNERKEEEERIKREEEQRLKAEQEKKSLEEAEKQRIELEEKLRKEEEERAERKKRLEKIMSRTRGKKSPSGSISGSDQLDSSENQLENLSSGANSLDSNGPAEGLQSLEGPHDKSEPLTDGASMEAHPTYEVASDNESLHDIVMPRSETASQDNSLVILPDREEGIKASVFESLVESLVDDMPGCEPVYVVGQDDAVKVSTTNIEKAIESSEHHKDEEDITVTEIQHKTDMSHFNAAPVSSATQIIDHSDVILSFSDAKNDVLSVSSIHDQTVVVEGGDDRNVHFSSSSDIKLPDPIYETTSEDGSLSSEKHQYGNAFQEGNNHESQVDDVFNEREVAFTGATTNFNPFDKQCSDINPMAAYESQFEVGGMQDSIYAYETSDAPLPDFMDQPSEFGEEKNNSEVIPISEGNLKHVEDISPSQLTNPFSVTDSLVDNFNIAAKDSQDLVNNLVEVDAIKNEQISTEKLASLNEPSPDFDSSNVTIIKSEDNKDCVGIISSIDHDQISNDLVNQQKLKCEQLKSNFDFSSVTDSEDSSLDSNLSQVMTSEVTVENGIVVDLNNSSSNSPTLPINKQAANPFTVNGNSDPKSNGDHFFSESETLKNGHRLTEFEQNGMDSSSLISSVDRSNSIFENVDAVSFGKMSSDPFLAKEMIPGNPFQLQEEGKPALMTPDFFN